MNILIARSALRVIRAIRSLAHSEQTHWLPSVDVKENSYSLLEHSMQLPCQSKTLLKHELFSESLETEGFDFDSVVANKNACLTLFDGLPEISLIQPLELGVFDKNREIRRKRLQTRMLSRKTPAAGILQLLPGIAGCLAGAVRYAASDDF